MVISFPQDNFMAISGAYQILSDENEKYVHDTGGQYVLFWCFPPHPFCWHSEGRVTRGTTRRALYST